MHQILVCFMALTYDYLQELQQNVLDMESRVCREKEKKDKFKGDIDDLNSQCIKVMYEKLQEISAQKELEYKQKRVS